ncbi:MAG TPA: carboxypeptidase-like regulatory domain-containing protein [Chryseolinea sp.]
MGEQLVSTIFPIGFIGRLLVVIHITCGIAHAQDSTRSIHGRIVSAENGAPVAYASITLNDSPIGSAADDQGYFQLKISDAWSSSRITLKISCIGFKTSVINDPTPFLLVRLEQAIIQLGEVTVLAQHPRKIVDKAFASIKKNYNTKPFLYHHFYRHYCIEDSVYGRLIEAAVEQYKTKGYRIQQTAPGQKEEVRVTQLRRSFDNTRIKDTHRAFGLYAVLGSDPVTYQTKASLGSFDIIRPFEVSILRKSNKLYDFTIDGMTYFDGEEVYKIGYRLKKDSSVLRYGAILKCAQSGVLYITSKEHAIVRAEFSQETSTEKTTSMTTYRKYNGKYYHQYSRKEGYLFNSTEKFGHTYVVEIMTGEIDLDDFPRFKGDEPGRAELAAIEYNADFWKNYNALTAIPLRPSILNDLQTTKSLQEQYLEYNDIEKNRYGTVKQDELRFFETLNKQRGQPVYVALWAAKCGTCVNELLSAKELSLRYGSKLSFVFVSLDETPEGWNSILDSFDFRTGGITHFRVGPESDLLKIFEVREIPHYVLIDRDGNFVDLNAKHPTNPELTADLEQVLIER